MNLFFTPHDLIQYLLLPTNQRQVVRSGMHVASAHLGIAMAKRTHQEKYIAIRDLGESGGVGMAAGIEYKLFREVILLSECSMGVRDSASSVVAVFTPRKDPFGFLVKRKAQLKNFTGSLGLRKATPSGSRFAFPYSHNASIRYISDHLLGIRNMIWRITRSTHVTLSETHRFFRAQSQIQHQNRNLLQRVVGKRHVLLFQFAIEHKRPLVLVRQKPDSRGLRNQITVHGKPQRFTQCAQFPVDGHHGFIQLQTRILVGLDGQLVNAIHGQLCEGPVLAQAVYLVGIKHRPELSPASTEKETYESESNRQ